LVTFVRHLKAFLVDERGTETVEWGVIAGFIIAGLVLTLASIGLWIKGAFNQIKTGLGA